MGNTSHLTPDSSRVTPHSSRVTPHSSHLTPHESKIFIAGHRGLVGSALVRRLNAEGYMNLLLRTSAELDLRDHGAVAAFFREEKPEYVFLAAAKVGGIVANTTYPVDFIYDNLMIQNNIIRSSYEQGVHRLLFLGSTCIYPRLAPQPMKEEHLLSDRLEPTNEPYAVAKIAGITLCRSYNRQFGARYLTAMPTNLYGPNDNFDLETSHVLPALIRKIHEARLSKTPTITVWGTGSPFREFLHVDDLADACLFLMQLSDDHYDDLLMPGSRSPVPGPPAIINIGSGEEISIRELAMAICDTVGYTGELVFDATRPDGPPRKLSDVSRMAALNWQSKIPLKQGLASTYEWYVSQKPLQA